MMSSWRERLLKCTGLPGSLRATKRPNIVIVNRPYHQARGFINAADVASAMQVRALICKTQRPDSGTCSRPYAASFAM